MKHRLLPERRASLLFVGTACCLIAGWANAQNWPVKPIRMYVGYSAGGSTDISARVVGQKMADELRQPVLVENRPGAGGALSIQAGAQSPADGYTLVMIAASATVLPSLRIKPPYDLERDLAPVALLATTPSVILLHPSVPAKDLPELITLARANPGKLNYASDGVGTNLHLAGELLNLLAKIRIVHVPYKGGTESAAANASGQVEMSLPSVTSALPLIKGGRLRPIAVTSKQRVSLLPDIPSVNDTLPDFFHSAWIGLLAPAGVPRDIVNQLNAMTGRIVNTADTREALNKQGLEPYAPTSADQFGAFIRNEIAQAAKLVKLAGLKPE